MPVETLPYVYALCANAEGSGDPITICWWKVAVVAAVVIGALILLKMLIDCSEKID